MNMGLPSKDILKLLSKDKLGENHWHYLFNYFQHAIAAPLAKVMSLPTLGDKRVWHNEKNLASVLPQKYPKGIFIEEHARLVFEGDEHSPESYSVIVWGITSEGQWQIWEVHFHLSGVSGSSGNHPHPVSIKKLLSVAWFSDFISHSLYSEVT